MKKFKVFAAAMLMLALIPFSVIAEGESQEEPVQQTVQTARYGRTLINNTMEGWNYFTNHNDGYYSNTEAHSGVRSYALDFSAGSAINLHTNSVTVTDKYKYYAETYVKGESSPSFISGKGALWISGPNYQNRKFLAADKTDKNGWVRYNALITPTQEQTSAEMVIYLNYGGKPELTYLPPIYFDDISIRVAPYSISTQSVVKASANKNIELKKMPVYGYDKDGNKERITNIGLFEWEVVSGSGRVDKNGNLVCTNKVGGTVNMKLTFCGVSTTFDVEFSGGISITAPKKYANGSTLMVIKNATPEAAVINTAILLYDANGRLYNVFPTEYTVNAGKSLSVTIPQVHVPYNMKNGSEKIVVSTPYAFESYPLEIN